MPDVKADQFEAHLKTGKIQTLYAFDGPELWLKEKATQQLISAVLKPESQEFNLDRFDGNTHKGQDILSSAMSLPFLSDRRLVIVQNADELNAAESKLLSESFSQLPTTTCLLFIYPGKADLKKEIPAQVISYGVLTTFWTPFPNQIPTWISKEMKNRGKSMTMDAAATLAEACQTLQEISNELDKLILFVGKKTVITLEDLMAHGLPNESGDYKDFEKAIWGRNLKDALTQAELLRDMGIQAEGLFPVLERVFRQLLLGNYYKTKRGWNAEQIYKGLNLRGRTQQDLFNQGMRSYSSEEIEGVFEKIIEADMDIKTGTLPNSYSLTFLLTKVLKRGERLVKV